MDPDLRQIEEELEKLSPHGMPDNLLARLDDAMCRWHESVPIEEKVVSLSEQAEVTPSSTGWFQWRAVAAVAILGMITAFAFSGAPEATPNSVTNKPQVKDRNVALTTFNTRSTSAKVVGLKDAGYVTDTATGQTMRCVGVKVSNRFDFRNSKGDKAQFEKPTYEVILVPLDVD